MNKVEINLHGDLANKMGRNLYKLAVDSVSEAMHALQIVTKKRLFKYFLEADKKGQKYRVLINKRDFVSSQPIDIGDVSTIANSELAAKIKNLKSIDIIPIIEGADEGIFQVILGVVLVIVGVALALTPGGPGGAFLIVAGIGLIAGGIISLLSKPPKFQDFREIDGQQGRTSYLFNGPQNTTREGGPVPVGYGRLLVGSQVISASYVIDEYETGDLVDEVGNIVTRRTYPGLAGGLKIGDYDAN